MRCTALTQYGSINGGGAVPAGVEPAGVGAAGIVLGSVCA
jgi:hypothetical protein